MENNCTNRYSDSSLLTRSTSVVITELRSLADQLDKFKIAFRIIVPTSLILSVISTAACVFFIATSHAVMSFDRDAEELFRSTSEELCLPCEQLRESANHNFIQDETFLKKTDINSNRLLCCINQHNSTQLSAMMTGVSHICQIKLMYHSLIMECGGSNHGGEGVKKMDPS